MSVLGIGTDIVDSRRLQRLITRRGEKALDRIFTADERAYAESANFEQRRLLRYANRYAAKEACLKALSGRGYGIHWHEIEITRHASGAPSLVLHGAAHRRAHALHPNYQLHLSLSDEAPYAMAYVLLCGV
ncbi:MAG: holo-[acyl-carrier-protein] synthase [Alphaproteobacteria bacterium]|nr:MAG: holo-[acyl-carrier-protein] synthase [Alphaproteobacteria bacterium]TAF14531.1 MAG: holo-[acyl-carrier-protein] synthase [Alphaproteobacteria bacterium]TAF39603.1 MAG: holo-[acyl-carrier-protein] synthase [Alphaproteobacteria bacterium]TAF74910.1 MAG: holo-[acyl-carrier-protein] synthase [Alphaproteobacteria bacterium]